MEPSRLLFRMQERGRDTAKQRREMTDRFHTTTADGISVTLDLDIGHLRAVEIDVAGRRLTPFYTAPWVDDPAIAKDASIVPNLRGLSGDFFCAALP